jgi:hypothetical protein
VPRRKDPRNSGKPKKPDPPSRDPERFRKRPDNYDETEQAIELENSADRLNKAIEDRRLRDELRAKEIEQDKVREKQAKDRRTQQAEDAKQDAARQQVAMDKHHAEVAERIAREQRQRDERNR